MTILTFNKKELEKRVGRITNELEKKITEMGTPVEEVTDKEISVEVFPNRPDLLSLNNFSRALNQFNGRGKLAKFLVNKPEKDFKVIIDKSVKVVRPYAVCAIVKKLNLDDKKIVELIDLQEKLHNSIGRKREKVAIGIYPLEKIKLPIKFVGRNSGEIKFRPLGFGHEMTGKQILKTHPAGIEYSKLLEGCEIFPVFVDAENKILSMPPIINSEETGRLNSKTKEIFIECSGHNLAYLKKTLNIILSSISEIGGKIYAVELKDSKGKNFISPDMSFDEIRFEIKNLEKTLGISLKEGEVKKYLGRMGIGYENRKGNLFALIPPYRIDILHWIDLTEEIAIAYGYENFEPEIPKISTIAAEDSREKTKRIVSEILSGAGILETSSFHLVAKKNVKKMHFSYRDFIEVEDSKTERDVLRIDMLTNLLQVLSENSDSAYPQKIFEIGKVFSKDLSEKSETGILEEENLSIAMIDEKITFTELKQVLDYLFRMLNLEYEIEEIEDNNYIPGRVGKIIVDGKGIGVIGELAPRVIKNWKIKMPIIALEIKLDFLF
jgi:phenylalanyl-tRNA synthetase beta chain